MADVFVVQAAFGIDMVEQDLTKAHLDFGNLIFVNFLKVFHESADRVAVRDEQDVLALLQARQDFLVKERHDAAMHILKRLAAWYGIVPPATNPLEGLVADFFLDFPLVLAGQIAVVTLIHRAADHVRHILMLAPFHDARQRLMSALLLRRIDGVEFHTPQEFTDLKRLIMALVGQVDVGQSGPFSEEIPF